MNAFSITYEMNRCEERDEVQRGMEWYELKEEVWGNRIKPISGIDEWMDEAM